METRISHALAEPELAEAVDVEEKVSTPVASHGMEALKDITFGSIAGAVGKVVEYPFDTIKVRLQSQPDHLPLQYKGPLDCFRQSLAADGVRSLYRGVSAPLTGAAAENASLFFSYRIAQDLLRSYKNTEVLSLPLLVTAGAMSGGVTSLILTPIELVKCRMQAPQSNGGVVVTRLSPFTVIGDVWRHEGVSGFWRGQLGTFLRETGGSAAWFGSYEACCRFFRSRMASSSDGAPVELPVSRQMASGAAAGMAYNFLCYPADTIKSKMQTGDLAQGRPNFLRVVQVLWRTHGLRGFYRGCGITVARSAPSSALIFTIMEQFKAAFP